MSNQYDKTKTKEQPIDILVISFGVVGITHPALSALYPEGQWEHISIPTMARERLLEAINRAILDMTGSSGRIIHDPAIWIDQGSDQ